MVAFDRTGREILRKRGHRDSVEIEPSELWRLRGSVITHNHPGGAIGGAPALRGLSFPASDVRTAATAQVVELRAITAGWRYSLRPPTSGWSYDWWQRVLEPTRRAARRDVLSILIPSMGRAEITRDEVNGLVDHETWTRVARTLGMTYTRTRVRI